MRRLRLEQGSADWHLWRTVGIGSSDASIIMGAYPKKWSTPLQLWEEKTKRRERRTSNFAMRRGVKLEPEARAIYEKRTDTHINPACVVHDSLDWLKASLDGMDLWESVVVEIKAPNAEDHQTALDGNVPEKYRWQLVHQSLVTGIGTIDYVSYNPDSFAEEDEFRVVPYTVSGAELAELLAAVTEFWGCIQRDVPPDAGVPEPAVVASAE